MRILCFGSLNIDRVYRVDRFVMPGETKAAREAYTNCGGKGLNQSIAAARAGCHVCHAAMLGRDGGMLLGKLEECGVDVSLMCPYEGESGQAVIEVDDTGQNRILLSGGANRAMTRVFVDETLERFGKSGLVLIQNETNLVPYIMERAAAMGLAVAFNAAPMEDAVLDYPLQCLRYLIINEIEGRAISRCDRDADALEALVRAYPDCGILLTLGREGAVYAERGEVVRIGGQRVQTVDTTAAGDTFTGYFLYGILDGLPADEALQIATAAAAISVTRPGAADSIPHMWEVEDMLRSGALQRLEVTRGKSAEY